MKKIPIILSVIIFLNGLIYFVQVRTWSSIKKYHLECEIYSNQKNLIDELGKPSSIVKHDANNWGIYTDYINKNSLIKTESIVRYDFFMDSRIFFLDKQSKLIHKSED